MTGPRFDGDLAAQWRAGRDGYGRRREHPIYGPAIRHALAAYSRPGRGFVPGGSLPDGALARVHDALDVSAFHSWHGRAGALYCQDGRP